MVSSGWLLVPEEIVTVKDLVTIWPQATGKSRITKKKIVEKFSWNSKELAGAKKVFFEKKISSPTKFFTKGLQL